MEFTKRKEVIELLKNGWLLEVSQGRMGRIDFVYILNPLLPRRDSKRIHINTYHSLRDKELIEIIPRQKGDIRFSTSTYQWK